MSTAFHPQTDGQTERLNREINQYLRTYVSDRQNEWAKWIKIAQFVWNNMVSEVTTDSLFGITWSYSPRMQFFFGIFVMGWFGLRLVGGGKRREANSLIANTHCARCDPVADASEESDERYTPFR